MWTTRDSTLILIGAVGMLSAAFRIAAQTDFDGLHSLIQPYGRFLGIPPLLFAVLLCFRERHAVAALVATSAIAGILMLGCAVLLGPFAIPMAVPFFLYSYFLGRGLRARTQAMGRVWRVVPTIAATVGVLAGLLAMTLLWQENPARMIRTESSIAWPAWIILSSVAGLATAWLCSVLVNTALWVVRVLLRLDAA